MTNYFTQRIRHSKVINAAVRNIYNYFFLNRISFNMKSSFRVQAKLKQYFFIHQKDIKIPNDFLSIYEHFELLIKFIHTSNTNI